MNRFPDVWPRLKAENPITQLVTLDFSPLLLNPEQRNLYDVVVRQYTDELVSLNPSSFF